MTARILYRDSQGRDGSFPLTDAEPCLIGRALDCAIRTDDALVSRQHSVIRMEQGRFFVEDLGSSNGTHVNDSRVTKHPLRHNDLVRCGSLWLRYVEESATDAQTAAGTRPAENELDDLVSQLRTKRALMTTVSGLELTGPTMPKLQDIKVNITKPDAPNLQIPTMQAALARAEANVANLTRELDKIREDKRKLESELAKKDSSAGDTTKQIAWDKNPAVIQDRVLSVQDQVAKLVEKALRDIDWAELRLAKVAPDAKQIASLKSLLTQIESVVGTLLKPVAK